MNRLEYNELLYSSELYHHGIIGQKWGVRRFQNPDGSLTDAGKKRYLNSDGSPKEKKVPFLKAVNQYKRTQDLYQAHDEYKMALEDGDEKRANAWKKKLDKLTSIKEKEWNEEKRKPGIDWNKYDENEEISNLEKELNMYHPERYGVNGAKIPDIDTARKIKSDIIKCKEAGFDILTANDQNEIPSGKVIASKTDDKGTKMNVALTDIEFDFSRPKDKKERLNRKAATTVLKRDDADINKEINFCNNKDKVLNSNEFKNKAVNDIMKEYPKFLRKDVAPNYYKTKEAADNFVDREMNKVKDTLSKAPKSIFFNSDNEACINMGFITVTMDKNTGKYIDWYVSDDERYNR